MMVQVLYPEGDLIRVNVHARVPNQRFIFLKEKDHFACRVEYIINIINQESGKQVFHKSWKDRYTESYYEDTRDPHRYIWTDWSLSLSPGDYVFSLMVVDLDSRREWNMKEKVQIVPPDGWSRPFLVTPGKEGFQLAGTLLQGKVDTAWFRFYAQEELPASGMKYELKYRKTVLDSGIVTPQTAGSENQFQFAVPVQTELAGELELKVSMNDRSETVRFTVIQTSADQYLQDLEEVVKLMSLILENDEYQELKKMKPDRQRQFIIRYWTEHDPTPGTAENELMVEFFERVDYANIHFGALNVGWRSDRGRIYIKYGAPSSIETSSQDVYGRTYQIWYYPSNKQFVFIDDGFGDYRLLREVN